MWMVPVTSNQQSMAKVMGYCYLIHLFYKVKVKVQVKLLSRVRLFATLWTVDYQAPLSMGLSRQECWSGLPFPSPGDLPNPGIESRSPALQADSLPTELYAMLGHFSRVRLCATP